MKVAVPVDCALSVICRSRKEGVPSVINSQLPMRASSLNCDKSGVSTSVTVLPPLALAVPLMKGNPSCCTVSDLISCLSLAMSYPYKYQVAQMLAMMAPLVSAIHNPNVMLLPPTPQNVCQPVAHTHPTANPNNKPFKHATNPCLCPHLISCVSSLTAYRSSSNAFVLWRMWLFMKLVRKRIRYSDTATAKPPPANTSICADQSVMLEFRRPHSF